MFIEAVGKELPGLTAFFKPVVQARAILRKSADEADAVFRLIGLAAKRYPEKVQGREYKRVFLGAGNPTGLSELAVLRGLATSKSQQAFDADELDIRSRSAALWRSGSEAWTLLSDLLITEHSPLAEEVIIGLSSSMPAEFLLTALDATSEVLAGIFAYNPGLACTDEVWTTSRTRQQRVSAALMICRNLVKSRSGDIITAALVAGADPTSPSLIDVFGTSSITTVLDWLDIDEEHLRQIPTGWQAALANHEIPVLEWLNSRSSVRPAMASFVLAAIGADALISNPLAISTFAMHAPQEGTAPDHVLIPFAARLLWVSLATDLPGAIDLASSCLDIVYHAAAESRLPNEVWQDLSSMLPEGYWWTWDRCLRLRKGVSEKFRSEQWPAARLADVTRDDKIFSGIVAVLKERASGRRVLWRAASAIEPGPRREELLRD